MLQLMELKLQIDEKGRIALPVGTLEGMNLHTGDEISLLYFTEEENPVNTSREFVLTKNAEGDAAGYEPMRGSFRFSVDKGDVAGRLAYLLGLDEAANVLISTNGNETEYRIKDIKVQITNNRLVSGSGTYSATVTLTLEIPVRFGGKEIANLPIFMRVKAAYRERFNHI